MRLCTLSCIAAASLALLVAPRASAEHVLVSGYRTNDVREFDLATGTFIRTICASSGLNGAAEMTVGPDGDLYVASVVTDKVARFDLDTGTLVRWYSGGGLNSPRGIGFGPDGMLYVSSADTGQILRFNPATGQFLNAFAIVTTPIGLVFKPGGDLYVVSVEQNQVLRLDAATGASKGVFASTGLNKPQSLTFGPDGDLFVHNQNTYDIVRFDGTSGAYEGIFYNGVYAYNPSAGLAFGSDGNLYTGSITGGAIHDGIWQFDGQTGAFERYLVDGNGNWWAGGLVMVPEPGTALSLSFACLFLLRRRAR